MNQCRNDVGVLEVEIVMRAVNVRRDDTKVFAFVLLAVCPAMNVNHPLCVRVRLVTWVRWTSVKHIWCHGVAWCWVGKYARREITHDALNTTLVCNPKDVRIHEHIVLVHLNRLSHVFEYTPDICSEMNHTIKWHVFDKQRTNFLYFA
jgi:hypothetical protein